MKTSQKESIPDHYIEDEGLTDLVKNLVSKDFSDLLNAQIGVVIKETEKQTISNKPAKLILCRKFDRYYHGKDYILEVERNVIRALTPLQFENLLFRTLSQATLNDKGEYKIQPPDFSFYKKEISKYGENGLYDIMEVIDTVRRNSKKKKIEDEIKNDSFEDFEE